MGFVCVCPTDLPYDSFPFVSHSGLPSASYLPPDLPSDPSDGGFRFRVRWMRWEQRSLSTLSFGSIRSTVGSPPPNREKERKEADGWILSFPSVIASPVLVEEERSTIPRLAGVGRGDGGMKTTRQRHWCVGSSVDRRGRWTRTPEHHPADAMAQFATHVRTTTHVGGRRMRRGTHGKTRATDRYAAHTAALSQAPHTQTNHTNGNGTTSMPSNREALKKIQAQAGTNRTCHAIEPWNRET